jgi:hypothetical protein
MATGDSVIRVSIIGDAKKLTGALKEADQKTSGFLKSAAIGAGATIAAFGVVDKVTSFLSTSLDEAGRLADAMGRLTIQMGPEFTANLEKTAGNFSRIGASKQDILEMEAVFADFATTAGIADTKIAGVAESVAATAAALALSDDQGRDSSAMLDLITKAAGGAAKAAKELGVTLIDGADASTQLDNILAQLNPKLRDATTGAQDFGDKSAEMEAKMESLSAELGTKLTPALNEVLAFFIKVVDDIPRTIASFEDFGSHLVGFAQNVLGPLGNVRDAIDAIINGGQQLKSVGKGLNVPIGGALTGSSRPPEHHTTKNQHDRDDRNGVVRDKIGGP